MFEQFKPSSRWLIIPVATALLAILPLPSEGYMITRTIITLSALYLVFGWKEEVAPQMKLIFIAVAILFNPVMPIYLYQKVLWMIIDLGVALLFFSQAKKSGD